jgi:YebC/PmpR family DNA-binding regulatory protein
LNSEEPERKKDGTGWPKHLPKSEKKFLLPSNKEVLTRKPIQGCALSFQHAKTNNMPKDRVDAAIKRASSKDEKDYEEVVYEGYGPYGVAILVETATDNATRTVANIRMYFTRGDGTLGKTGSLDFIFTRKGVFRFDAAGVDKDELELELIDYGLDEIEEEEGELVVYTPYQEFARMQKFLEEKGISIKSAQLQRISNTSVSLTQEQEDEIMELIEKFEQDDDVTAVFHNVG